MRSIRIASDTENVQDKIDCRKKKQATFLYILLWITYYNRLLKMQKSLKTLLRKVQYHWPSFLILCGLVLLFTIYETELIPSPRFVFKLYQPNRPVVEYIVLEDKMEFEGFNNVTGAERLIVPNIIHFIRFGDFELKFIDYLVLLAAMRNHRPDKFYIHTNEPDVQYTGKYWDWVRKDEELWTRIKVLYLEVPTEIFGQQLYEDWYNYHGSDIERIRVLMKYGGIYLDNDVFIIRSLDKYRKYELAISWDENQLMGNQVIIAHKDARFLALWLDSYRNYRSDLWYEILCLKSSDQIIL